jgi:hypothetical protein
VSTPQAGLIAATGRVRWQCGPPVSEVVCSCSVLDETRREAVEGFNRLSHGGLEVGGVLFGKQTKDFLEILESRPLTCEHRFGPSFVLSDNDEIALQEVFASPVDGALRPLGLYISHSRSGFSVTENDKKILERHFPQALQVALILSPTQLGPARAGLFVRDSAGEPEFKCAHEFLIQPGEPAADETSAKREVPTEPIVTSRPDISFLPEPATVGPAEINDVQLERSNQERRRYILSRWAAAVMLALLGVLLAGLWEHTRVSSPNPGTPVHLSVSRSQLRIEWDRTANVVRIATAAHLEVRDGNRQPIQIPITREGLDRGGITYSPKSETIEVRVKFFQGQATVSDSVLYFIKPATAVPEPTARAAMDPAQAPGPAGAGPAGAAPTGSAAAVPEVPKLPPESKPTNERPPINADSSAPAQTVDKKFTARVFRLPAPPPPSLRRDEPNAGLPDVPHITSAPTLTPQALPAIDPTGVSITVPAPAAPPTRQPVIPQSGRLIWTGELRKNGLLSVSSAGTSMGVLNGHLPGFPVTVRVLAAELVDGGITVFTDDSQRSAKSEPPSASNGWNVVVYKWDPRRAADLTIIEAPAPSNNWQRLVIRNGSRNVGVLVINWQHK